MSFWLSFIGRIVKVKFLIKLIEKSFWLIFGRAFTEPINIHHKICDGEKV